MNKNIVLLGIALLLTGCKLNSIKENETIEISKEEFNNKFEEIYNDKNIEINSEKIYLSETEKNPEVENSIELYLDYNKNFGDLKYLYNYIDLDDDGIDEILVYLLGEYVSGSGGSTLLILNSNDMKVVEDFTLINNPVLISNEKTKGFKNIIVPVYGGGEKLHFVELKYNGKNYESNPSMVEERYQNKTFNGKIILADDISPEVGIYLE